MLRKATLSLALQGATVISKSLLLFLLAHYLSAAELGQFGLIAVTVSLAVHATGLDFYAFATREILATTGAVVPRLVRDQAVFHALSYLVVLPVLLLVFASGLLPSSLMVVSLCLVLLEHLAQELHRLLVTLGRPVKGAVLLFIRGGAWVYVVGALMAADPTRRSVQFICLAWCAGIATSLVLGLFYLRDLEWRPALDSEIDWTWIRRGIAISLPLLAASSSLRAILTLDRYVLQIVSGAAAVGIYTFYSSIRSAVQGSLDMGVLFIWRPRIVAAYQRGDHGEYRRMMRRLSGSLAGLSALLLVVAGLCIRPLLTLVDRPIYGEHLGVYVIVIAQAAVFAAAEIPHTALYARGRDRAILRSTVAGLIAAFVLNLLLVPRFGLAGAAWATLLGAAMTGVAKAASLRGEA